MASSTTVAELGSERRQGLFGTFFLSTLLPITAPIMPPAAAPITPPFTLFLLVTAPSIAPAPAPMAASRFVFFST